MRKKLISAGLIGVMLFGQTSVVMAESELGVYNFNGSDPEMIWCNEITTPEDELLSNRYTFHTEEGKYSWKSTREYTKTEIDTQRKIHIIVDGLVGEMPRGFSECAGVLVDTFYDVH